jgi:drug/metabolite transporter (DMT)-like permease
MEARMWLVYVALAGLAWGTYVPIIFYGGSELGGRPNARLMAILCVGIAYFVIGVLFPLLLFLSGQHTWPEMKLTGLAFSGLAGAAGAVGAICVIFAAQSARAAAPADNPDAYRVYIAPLIFGLAPVINTLVSTVWHPEKGEPFHFSFKMPHPLLWVGILLVGVGAALVLYSKEISETPAPTTQTRAQAAAAPPPAAPEARP